ncbi:MAG: hypothetical protein GXC76_12955 [Rhodanobacteraceae bacterium]|jgi:hypothetical protein|nr:hypothetical protein [Rhodanobacteraceae bacterium]
MADGAKRANAPVNVICMKWGDKYGDEYVVILRNMVARHLARPHRFVCLTDSAGGLPADLETLPLPACPVIAGREQEAWRKLSLFGPGLGDLSGPTLFLDLDLIVVDALDPLFDFEPGRFCIIHNWTHPDRRVGNSSVFRFEAGRHPQVFERYARDPATVVAAHRNEQIFLTQRIDKAEGAVWWPAPWCVSFKKHCLPRGPAKLLVPARIPAGARVVVFHGEPNPPQAAREWRYKGHHFMRPARWILDYWY